MIAIIGQWLDLLARLKSEGGAPLFVLVSYTLTTLVAISAVRAVRLDRRNAKRPALGTWQLRRVAFYCGAPIEWLIAYFWGVSALDSVLHAIGAGLAVPVVADLWIRLLYARGCAEQARVFKADPPADNGDITSERGRL